MVDVDLKSYFDTIDHELLLGLVERRVGDVQILRLIRAWLKAGVMEEGKVTHPDRGSPQGGVISPLLSNIFLHEVDRNGAGATVSPPVTFGWSVMRTTWYCWRERNNRRGRRGINCRCSLRLFIWW